MQRRVGEAGFQLLASTASGRASDGHKTGTPISRILGFGDWGSAAVLRYLAIPGLGQMTALSVSLDESNSQCAVASWFHSLALSRKRKEHFFAFLIGVDSLT